MRVVSRIAAMKLQDSRPWCFHGVAGSVYQRPVPCAGLDDRFHDQRDDRLRTSCQYACNDPIRETTPRSKTSMRHRQHFAICKLL